jgi:23S rRNA (cytosine1962-C5)-methyltransferase
VKVIVNEKGKRRILAGHPWVFRSDIKVDSNQLAGIVLVSDEKGRSLGKAFFSPHSQITLRMITPRDEVINVPYWEQKIKSAHHFRESVSILSNAYRVIFGESDGIPSFILDRYGDAFAFQILSAGLETERENILDAVKHLFRPTLLVERNDVSVRNLEKLPLSAQIVEGNIAPSLQVREGDLRFEVDLLSGQKTGAFLDQRENRFKAALFAKGRKRVLDAFSYQGWFACHLAKKTEEVVCVEQSEAACKQIEANALLNELNNITVVSKNVFDYLHEADQGKERFDLINLDPPAFVKSRRQLSQAIKGYKEINLRALKLLKNEGILITSSCSFHISDEEFLEVIRDAAQDAKRRVQIIGIGHQASDHPILVGFPESKYLKCLFLRVI